MKTGLLWYDDDPARSLDEKVVLAARRYREKFGRDPDSCYVHPSALGGNGKGRKMGPVQVTARRSVLRHHFWLGREENVPAHS